MILEVAVLDVIPGKEHLFEKNFKIAEEIISQMDGYINHQLQQCIEQSNRYLLLVNWAKLEDHTIGFRTSAKYQEWKALLHQFYDPFPTVQHYQTLETV